MSASPSSTPFGPSPPPSFTGTTTTTSATPSSTGTSNSTTDATLYLYTFLATLVLLLAVSSAIVIRSLILRRRHQRLVEEAIRTGAWLPSTFDSPTGRRRRDFGQKPKLWEAWLHPSDDDADELNEKNRWLDITPFYAAYSQPPTSPQGAIAGSPENAGTPTSRPSRFMPPFTRRRPPPLPQPQPPITVSETAGKTPSSASSPPASTPPATPPPAVIVGVLIAMPGASHKRSGDDSGPPVVEIGVVEARVKIDESEIPPSRGDS